MTQSSFPTYSPIVAVPEEQGATAIVVVLWLQRHQTRSRNNPIIPTHPVLQHPKSDIDNDYNDIKQGQHFLTIHSYLFPQRRRLGRAMERRNCRGDAEIFVGLSWGKIEEGWLSADDEWNRPKGRRTSPPWYRLLGVESNEEGMRSLWYFTFNRRSRKRLGVGKKGMFDHFETTGQSYMIGLASGERLFPTRIYAI